MKNCLIMIFITLIVLFVADACMPADTVVINGELQNIEFNSPGKSIMTGLVTLEKYALADHVYTTDDYTVTAVYTNGDKKDVTASAEIKGEYVNVSSSGLTFSSKNENHTYKLNVSYGGKTISAEVYAYKAGEFKECNIKSSKFFAGTVLSNFNISGDIAYMDNTGVMTYTNYLPKTGTAKIYTEYGEETASGTLRTIRALKEEDKEISYSIYENSENKSFDIEVIPLSEAKLLAVHYPMNNVKAGDEINLDTFVSTYMVDHIVNFYDEDTPSDSNAKIAVHITDDEGKIIDDAYQITVVIKRDGSEITTGYFAKGDEVSITVTYKASEEKTIEGKKDYKI